VVTDSVDGVCKPSKHIEVELASSSVEEVLSYSAATASSEAAFPLAEGEFIAVAEFKSDGKSLGLSWDPQNLKK
jgi:hypothetical protein